MCALFKEYIMFGMDNYNGAIEKILSEIHISEETDSYFELKLILVEAITNSFIHGNKRDKNKEIKIRYLRDDYKIRIEVEDMGCGYDGLKILEEISDDNLLDSSGRGLYLISCMADSVEVNGNVILIEKNLLKSAV